MTTGCYYKILNLEKSCNDADIRKSYKKLAIKWHPDKNQTDDKVKCEEMFKKISEAYSVLSDPKKRKIYDMGGDPNSQYSTGGSSHPWGGQAHPWGGQAHPWGGANNDFFHSGFGMHDASKIFEEFFKDFGGMHRPSGSFGSMGSMGSFIDEMGGFDGMRGSSSFTQSFSNSSMGGGPGGGACYSKSTSTVSRNGKTITTVTETINGKETTTVTETDQNGTKRVTSGASGQRSIRR
eukprot:GHVL01027749.1.p1 GENE.GHVL01027749.1~~GHVL01027749.1.p1  ORF type:complete len:236 (+),score=45.74 GHVL01027749.1:187-894(+)